MRRESKRNKIIIFILAGIVCLMGIGYAAFQTQLEISAVGNISGEWKVRITNVEVTEEHGSGVNKDFSFEDTSANLEADLYSKGDYVVYTITVSNEGTFDAKLDALGLEKSTNDAVIITSNGLIKGQPLLQSETIEFTVKIEYNAGYTGEDPVGTSGQAQINLNFVQNSGGDIVPSVDYLVKYDYQTNGGTSTNAEDAYIAEGSPVNLSYTAVQEGYEFMGWNTDKGAANGLESLNMPASNVTLYAIFRKIDTTPPTISNVSTSSTTNSITVVTTASEDIGEIVKYEYKINDEEYVEGESTKTFTGLTAGESYRIKVRVTNSEGLTSESEEKQVTTSVLNKPTFRESGEKPKTVTINYPAGEGLTYEYKKDSGEWTTATQNQKVEFTESGTLVARVSDGTNTESASLTVEVKQDSAGSDLVDQAGTVTSGDGLYADSYEENVYTYRGANPNNYVTFNGEQWRIISVNTSDNTIKIMRNAVLSDRQFDTSSGRYQGSSGYCNNSSYGCNIWGSSSTLYDTNLSPITTLGREYNGTKYTLPTAEAPLNTYLNGEYYNGLNATAKSMIKEDAVYKVGVLYYNNNNITTDMNQLNAAKWKGKIGLIDPSEYLRASTNSSCTNITAYYNKSSCYNNSSSHNWMYLNDYWWTLSPTSNSNSYNVWYVSSSGDFFYYSYAYSSRGVRPVLTLNSNIQITGGTGTSSSPYTLGV